MTRILVVDDDKILRRTYREAFADEGYEVEFAGSGFEALARVRARRPDCVITDCLMEDMDGIETMDHILEIDSTIPVILCSACPGLEDNETSDRAFASLDKSDDLSQLKDAVFVAVSQPVLSF